MMRVLFVAHSGEISGGANRSLLSIMTGLREAYGVAPSVLVPEADSPLTQKCAALEIPVYVGKYHSCCTMLRHEWKDVLRLAKLAFAPILDYWQARRLNGKLPRDFDLIYTNERMTIMGGYLAKMRGIPHVWHVRCFSLENRTLFPLGWYRLMNRFADHIVLISHALYDDFVRHVSASKLRVVHNGLETEQYLSYTRQAHEGFRLLLTGRIIPPKGQDEALQALNALVHRHGMDASLYFAGQVPSYGGGAFKEQLCSFIGEHKLWDRVHFLNEVSDMLSIRSEMDVEIVCSWKEAFGRVTVEAMMAGLPVVGTRCGGTAEIIEDGETGFLYAPHDSEELIQKLLWLYNHPVEAGKMGEKGRKRAEELFSVKKLSDNIMKVIREIHA